MREFDAHQGWEGTMSKDKFSIERLSYDSGKESATYRLKGDRDGQRSDIWGSFQLPTPGDLPESEVRALAKARLAELLRAAADSL